MKLPHWTQGLSMNILHGARKHEKSREYNLRIAMRAATGNPRITTQQAYRAIDDLQDRGRAIWRRVCYSEKRRKT